MPIYPKVQVCVNYEWWSDKYGVKRGYSQDLNLSSRQRLYRSSSHYIKDHFITTLRYRMHYRNLLLEVQSHHCRGGDTDVRYPNIVVGEPKGIENGYGAVIREMI